MRAKEFIKEEMSYQELQAVERFADSLWKRLGINVDFTRHFMQRVNDERNGKPITAVELIRLFKKEYEQYGKKIADMDADEAVFKDVVTKLNLPFVISDRYDHRELVAKTVMRKKNFHTPNKEFVVNELKLPKNQWELLMSQPDKEEAGHELVDLVKTAYSNTPKGSFVQSLKDVMPSDWQVIDWDEDPDVDACVFFRVSRPNETWTGYKIQGLGHDGTRTSKDKALAKIVELLQKDGYWAESSDAMRHLLKKMQLPPVTDVSLLKRLFKGSNLRMVAIDTYKRTLESGETIIETVFGRPKLKSGSDKYNKG